MTLGSVANPTYFTPSEAGAADGDTLSYVIVDGSDVEVGVGTLSSSVTVLSRDTVYLSRIGGTSGTSKINLSGTAKVFLTVAAEDLDDLLSWHVIRFGFNGTGIPGPYNLGFTPASPQHVTVFVGGVYQDDFTISGDTITFGFNVGLTEEISGFGWVGRPPELSTTIEDYYWVPTSGQTVFASANALNPTNGASKPVTVPIVNDYSCDLWLGGIWLRPVEHWYRSGSDFVLTSPAYPADAKLYLRVRSSLAIADSIASSTLTTQGDLLYRDAVSTTRLPAGSAGMPLRVKDSGVGLEYSTLPQTSVTGLTTSLSNLGYETVTASPSANQNDYAPGISASKLRTTLVLTPTKSIKLTGISTSGWTTGKRLVIRNGTSTNGSNSALIILERLSTSSTSGNRFGIPAGEMSLPIFLMPGDNVEFEFNGSSLVLVNGLADTRQFDSIQTRLGVFYSSSWTSGTGATAFTHVSNITASGRGLQNIQLVTGTTTTGRSYAACGGSTYSLGSSAGCGALLSLNGVWLDVLATGTDDYVIPCGFIDDYTSSGVLTDGVCWLYDRSTSTDWQLVAFNNTVATWSVVTGFTPTASTYYLLGVFVNGNGSKAEFFYSTDEGETWTITTATLTTGLPSSGRRFGHGVGIRKTAGTNSRNVWTPLSVTRRLTI